MGTTRQRQRLLINGLVTVFLLSLLGGCVPPPAPNGDGSNVGDDSQPSTTATTTAPTPAPTPAPDILGLKAELAAIEKLVFKEQPQYVAAKEELTKFQQSFQAFSEKYKDNNKLKRQIDKISDLLKDVESYLDDSELQKRKAEFDEKLRLIFADLKAGLDSFTELSKTPQGGTTTPQNHAQKPITDQGSTPPTNTSKTQSDSQGDRQSGLTFGQVIFANFLATGFTILLVVGIMKVSAEISNQRRDGRRNSNNPAATNPQANTLPQQNNLQHNKGDGQLKQLVDKIDVLTAEFNKLSSGITNFSDNSPTKYDISSLQTTLNSIQTEIASIPSSISGAVSRTSSYDNNLVQSYLNQIGELNQETQNLRDHINLLQSEKGTQSDEIRDLKAQLDKLLNSHTNAVSLVQYNQLEQRFNDLREEHETLKNNYNNLEQSIRNNNAANQGELEKRDRKLTDVQQKLDQVNSALTKVTAERDKLQEERDKLQEERDGLQEKLNKFNRIQSSNDNSYQTNSVISSLSIGTQSNSSSSSPLPADIQRLVGEYNQNPKSLQNRKAAAVDFTGTDYNAYMREGSPAILENTTKTGGYWVVNSSSNTWLFPPDTKLKLKGDHYALSALYECHQYQENLTKFTLIKPAKVTNLGSGKWQLIEKGELEFTS